MTTAPRLTTSPKLGIGMMLMAWGFFALVDSSVKWLVLAGIPALFLAFVRYAGQFFITALVGGLRISSHVSKRHLGLLCLRAFLLVSATACNFFALNYLPLSITASILFSSPLFVCLLSMPLLGERVGMWRWGAIGLGFVGVLVVVQPFDEGFHIASLLIVYCAFAMALFSILTRKLAHDVDPHVMQFVMGAIGTSMLLPLAIWNWSLPTNTLEWALTLSIGFWAWAGHEIFARAHFYAPAHTLMPFSYSFILYLSAASYLIWADIPNPSTALGAGIIVCSGLIIWWRETRQEGRAAV